MDFTSLFHFSLHFTSLFHSQPGRKGVDTGGAPRQLHPASTFRQMLALGIWFTGLHRPLPKQDLRGTYLLRYFPTSKFSNPMRVLTCTNCPCSDDPMGISYLQNILSKAGQNALFHQEFL